MGDRDVHQEVLDQLEFVPGVEKLDLQVSVRDGIVTLSGHVTSYGQKMAVERAARRAKGVRAVAQELEVRLPEAAMIPDDEIARRAVNVLKWNSMLPCDAVQVSVSSGWITLSGEVEWQYQRSAAEDAVRPLPGVIAVINKLTVKPHVRVKDVKQKIGEALKQSAEAEANRINVFVSDDGTVVLDGKVRDSQEHTAVRNAAWSAPGVEHVLDHLTVA
jgi:osmotically-inducible protein OsmY